MHAGKAHARLAIMRDLRGWVDRLQAGDDAAWQDFILEFSRFIPLVSRGLGLTEVEREEALQETTLIAYRSVRNLSDPDRLASWVYTIARRAAISQLRSRRDRQSRESGDDRDLTRIPSDDLPVDEVLAHWEDTQHLRAAVLELKPSCRQLVEDLYFRDPRLSYKEISSERGIPVGSIGPTLARCLATLRQIWIDVSRRALPPSAGE